MRENSGAIIRIRRHKGHPPKHQTQFSSQPINYQNTHQSGRQRTTPSQSIQHLIQLELLRMISNLFAANSFNSLVLAKRDREIMEFNHSILESLISLVFSIKEHTNAEDMANLVIPFIHSYPISSKIVKTILAIIAKDFYYEKLAAGFRACVLFLAFYLI